MTTPDQPRMDRAEEIAQAWRREDPELPVDSIGILTRIHHAAKLLTDERRRILAHVDIDSATLDLLSTLRRSGKPYRLSTRELATHCLITPGAVTQRVERAQNEGLVRKLAPQPGTRLVSVELTPDGHHAVKNAVTGLLHYEQSLVDVLAPRDQKELARLLTVLLQGLNDRAV